MTNHFFSLSFYAMENQQKFLQNVEEERFLLQSNPRTGGKLVENWRKTGGNGMY